MDTASKKRGTPADSCGTRLFGTSGIRGDAEHLFTDQFCFDLGRAFAVFLTKHRQPGPVAVGSDPRTSSPRIKSALAGGLVFEGREVLDQGVCPVPATHYCLFSTPAVGSAMITGSHIAAHLNGVKFFAFKEEILKNQEVELEDIYGRLRERQKFLRREVPDTEDNTGKTEYEEMLVRLAGKLPAMSVVVDSGNGAQAELMSRVLRRVGLTVYPLHDRLQDEFMTRDTETEDSFRDLQRLVRQKKADLGLGFDSDGDRVAFVDEKGRYLPGDYSGSLLAREADGRVTVTPINTSAVVESIGKRVIRTKVGSPYVVAAMKKHGAAFGFESNGGGIHADIMLSRDGGSTVIRFLQLLVRSGKTLSGLTAELPALFISKAKVDCPAKLNQIILAAAAKTYSRYRVERLDGLKIWLDKSTWILFRPSSNSPEFRVFAESPFKRQADQLVADGLELVKTYLGQNS